MIESGGTVVLVVLVVGATTRSSNGCHVARTDVADGHRHASASNVVWPTGRPHQANQSSRDTVSWVATADAFSQATRLFSRRSAFHDVSETPRLRAWLVGGRGAPLSARPVALEAARGGARQEVRAPAARSRDGRRVRLADRPLPEEGVLLQRSGGGWKSKRAVSLLSFCFLARRFPRSAPLRRAPRPGRARRAPDSPVALGPLPSRR